MRIIAFVDSRCKIDLSRFIVSEKSHSISKTFEKARAALYRLQEPHSLVCRFHDGYHDYGLF
jgi:hypothetical protein